MCMGETSKKAKMWNAKIKKSRVINDTGFFYGVMLRSHSRIFMGRRQKVTFSLKTNPFLR